MSRTTSKRLYSRLLAIVMGFFLVLGVGYLQNIELGIKPTIAQSIRPEYVAQIVYQRLTSIPKENQYIRKETGEVDPTNTLISRLVRYHQDVKKRPTMFRLDWQITLADYLGINEPIKEERYPGQSTLTANPMQTDIKAIRGLNRRQREELVSILVSVYTPQTPTPKTPENVPQPTPQPSPSPSPNKPPLSKPGDADLLK